MQMLWKARIAKKVLERAGQALTLADALSPEPWCVDHVGIVGDHLEMHGWALPPSGDTSRAVFCLDGAPFAHIDYPMPRPDIERFFWYLPGAARSGFVCRSPLTRMKEDMLDPYVLTYSDRNTGQSVNPEHEYYYYRASIDDVVLPPGENRRRVQGHDSESVFRVEGYTNFLKLRRVLKQHFGRDYDSFSSILDWGCGCGRMTRYFRWVPQAQVTGIDIDAGNVAWCRENLRFGQFLAAPLHPPTPLRDEQFDLLIGISVFSHLLEPETEEWLRELGRIAKPGAILLMTIHGEATAARSDLPAYMWRAFKRKGMADGGPNPDLEQQMSVQDYYRNTFFNDKYVRRHWARHFEIVAILPACIGNHQDLVVMRKH